MFERTQQCAKNVRSHTLGEPPQLRVAQSAIGKRRRTSGVVRGTVAREIREQAFERLWEVGCADQTLD